MSQNFPTVSIIIPSYNRAHYLIEALDSALNQTYPNLEVIVVNDGSTDETEEILAPYRKRIRYITQENRGWAGAKNRGLEAATGEFLCILDDDDRIHPKKVERQLTMFQQDPDLGVCATGINLIDAEGNLTESFIPPPLSPRTQVFQLLRRCLVNQSSAMLRRECYETLGGLKPIHSDDYEYWLRASLHYRISVVPELLTDYRRHPNQLTAYYASEIDHAAAGVIRDFIAQATLEQIIPGLCSYPEGYAALGVVLCERKLFAQAQTHLERALPNPAGNFGLGILKLHERNFTQAKTRFQEVRASHSPLASKVPEALSLVERIQTVLQQPGLCNTTPQVIELRRDLSHFHAVVIRQLLALARGGNGGIQ